MKLEIYKEKKEKETTTKVELRDYGGDILLAVVNDNGTLTRQGHILTINNEGTITRCTGVNEDFGLELDDDGRIKLDE